MSRRGRSRIARSSLPKRYLRGTRDLQDFVETSSQDRLSSATVQDERGIQRAFRVNVQTGNVEYRYGKKWKPAGQVTATQVRDIYNAVTRGTSNADGTINPPQGGHNALPGLQGGGQNEYYHLTLAQYGDAVAFFGLTLAEGDIFYVDADGVIQKLAGNTAATRKFLLSLGDGANAAAPAWAELEIGDVGLDPADTVETLDGGAGAAGTSDEYSRGDHQHPISNAASDAQGVVELATATETTTGTDADRAVTPDGLAGSDYGKRLIYLRCFEEGTALATGDGKRYCTIPAELNGWNLVAVMAAVYTVSSSGTPTVQVHNLTDTADMLSTRITIDANEYSSATAAAPPAINGAADDVATGDRLRIDVDVAGTGTKGLDVVLTFQLP